jgi:hypothetical protein
LSLATFSPIHGNYLLRKDVDICLGYNVATLADQPVYPAITALFDAFVGLYPTEEA